MSAPRSPAGNHAHGAAPGQRALAAWRQHHGQCLAQALRRPLRRPLSAWSTIIVIAIVLALPGLAMTLASQITRIGGLWVSDNAQFNVYLKADAKAKQISRFSDWLGRQPQVESHREISPSEGLKSLTERLHLKDLDMLGDNPLPTVFVVRLSSPATQTMLTFRQQLQANPAVDSVSEGGDWIKRLQQISEIVQTAGWTLLLMLGITVVFVIGNTLRLEMQERQAELQLIALIGGTRRYMLRPLLYDGLVMGAVGGLLAGLVVYLVMGVLSPPLNHFAASYGATINTNPPPTIMWLLGLAGAVLGWLSAQITGRYSIGRLGII